MTRNSTCPLSFIESFVLSGSAAVISKTAVAPVERVKLLLQNQPELVRCGRITDPYKGILDCTIRVFKSEGILAFWRSNMVNCIRYFPTQALNFAFKDQIKKFIKTRPKESYAMKIGKNIFAGGTAGALSTCFVYSLDFARTLLANDAKDASSNTAKRKYSGLIDVYRQTVRSSGLASLYTGFFVSVVAIFIYRGLYFGLYDTLKPIISEQDTSLLSYFAIGYGVTVTANLVAYPIDTIRRRMMMAVGHSVKYHSSIQCAAHILRTEGFRSLMKGAGINVVRSFAGGGVLAGFESFSQIYLVWKAGKQEEIKTHT